jgi:hypothetical protein
LDAAHIIPRSRVGPPEGDHPLNIVPCCRPCHSAYDLGTLDLLPHITLQEQGYAASLVGLDEARQRITNERYWRNAA